MIISLSGFYKIVAEDYGPSIADKWRSKYHEGDSHAVSFTSAMDTLDFDVLGYSRGVRPPTNRLESRAAVEDNHAEAKLNSVNLPMPYAGATDSVPGPIRLIFKED